VFPRKVLFDHLRDAFLAISSALLTIQTVKIFHRGNVVRRFEVSEVLCPLRLVTLVNGGIVAVGLGGSSDRPEVSKD